MAEVTNYNAVATKSNVTSSQDVETKEEVKEEHVPKPAAATAQVAHPTFAQRAGRAAMNAAKNGWKNIIFPSIQEMLLDYSENLLKNIIYLGEPPKTAGVKTSSGVEVLKAGVSRFAYESQYKKKNEHIAPKEEHKSSDILLGFGTKAEAEDVKSAMEACLEQYHWASVRDYYEYADMAQLIDSNSERMGWYFPTNIRVKAQGDLWALILPPPVPMQKN